MIYTRWSEEAGWGKKQYRKGLTAPPLAIAFTRDLLVSSKLLRGVENNLRHEALSKGYRQSNHFHFLPHTIHYVSSSASLSFSSQAVLSQHFFPYAPYIPPLYTPK